MTPFPEAPLEMSIKIVEYNANWTNLLLCMGHIPVKISGFGMPSPAFG
jgi:hypothetical protein